MEGIASAIGGVRYLDMVFVMDTSTSLRSSDPNDYRSQGAVGLVENLSPRSDIKIGVVSFDSKGQLSLPLTSDRESAVNTLRHLPRSGSTNLAAGILTALRELTTNGRPGSSRVIMLFTDGMSNEQKGARALDRGVVFCTYTEKNALQKERVPSHSKGTHAINSNRLKHQTGDTAHRYNSHSCVQVISFL